MKGGKSYFTGWRPSTHGELRFSSHWNYADSTTCCLEGLILVPRLAPNHICLLPSPPLPGAFIFSRTQYLGKKAITQRGVPCGCRPLQECLTRWTSPRGLSSHAPSSQHGRTVVRAGQRLESATPQLGLPRPRAPEPGTLCSLLMPEGPQSLGSTQQEQKHRKEKVSVAHSCSAPPSWATGTPTSSSKLGRPRPSFCAVSSVIWSMSPLGWGT